MTLISIGHRSTLTQFHKDRLEAKRQESGTFKMEAAKMLA
jgi:ABC-type uncharacterized transport system fused permease/ATPase subunit